MTTLPKNLPADARRAATVEAVVALAATQNPSDITTTAIAQQMQLTQGALFRHFANKDAILLAVMEWVAERLLARIDQAAASTASPRAALQAVFLAHVGFVAAHPGVPRIIFSELQRAGETPPKRAVQTLVGSYGTRLHQLISQGQAQGELRADLDVQAAATLFIGTVQGLVMQSLITGDMARMCVDAQRVFAIYQRGIEAGQESTR
ncbi:TetR/AcrR family transcriptional regulator [Simplicispira psychrophila]|uniref:TetR/AcrR family transcriptional regulator n=1 Tax=Simplicispira psychrophila TaxID=80882 RepID=UPI0004859509|nr:TetR/AcrR family transcriptional regulator [Simplicispira psychrophila]